MISAMKQVQDSKRDTLPSWLRKRRMNEKQFLAWLGNHGVLISPKYLSDVLSMLKPPGPVFCSLFKEITGVQIN